MFQYMEGSLVERFGRHVRRARLFGPRRGAAAASDPATALVAVSGGPDSVALLDLLHRLAPELRLRLVVTHVDHGIRSDSAATAAAVGALARRYLLPVDVGVLGLGPAAGETAARRARYAWLREAMARHGARYLVTAHHRDDQVETILIRLLRGSAPAGLAGMPARGRGGLVRPLLPFARADLAAHVAELGLPTHEDPANQDHRHLRSWVRQAVVPLLVERLGAAVTGSLIQSGRHAARSRRAWRAVVDLLPDLHPRVTAHGFDVARSTLGGYDASLAIEVLGALGRRLGLVLGPRRARAVVRLARGPSGRRLALGGGWVAEAALDRLRVGCHTAIQPTDATPRGRAGTLRFGPFRVRWRPERAPERLERDGWTTWIPAGDWLVRGPAAGDRLAPLRGIGRREVRRLLSEARVAASDRAAWPVVVRAGAVLWVPGVCRAAAAVPPAGTEAVRIDVIRRDRG